MLRLSRKTNILNGSYRVVGLHNYVTNNYYSTTNQNMNLRIGCASGFWGDTATSVQQLVNKGKINYLVFDYLSEITMSLLTAAKRKNPDLGYAPDFVLKAMAPNLSDIMKQSIKVISNSGGVNPMACADALQKVAEKQGFSPEIAVVTGDDLIRQLKSFQEESIMDMYSGKEMPASVVSMNAYLGALPIKKALDLGAQIVITGRCVDSAVVLGPLMHFYKWQSDDYNKLAAGSLAGHLLECGAQSTGGIFTDWHKVEDWDNIGFPIAECYENGEFLLTKPENTGGLVSFGTAAEQLTYEIGDPRNYILPDVVCDFSNVEIKDLKNNSVHVKGAIGKPPPKDLKVCATYMSGFRTTAVFSVGGKRAARKGRKTAESILKRMKTIFHQLGLKNFTKTHIEIIGEEFNYGKNKLNYGADKEGPRETVVWIAVEHSDKKALEIFTQEIAAAGTGMAPGLCGIVGGRPKVSPILKLFSFLYPSKNIPAFVELNGHSHECPYIVNEIRTSPEECENLNEEDGSNIPAGGFNLLLEDVAFTRSGDKGNNANIGVIARTPDFFPYIKKHLTAEAVYFYFEHLFESKWDNKSRDSLPVTRYELPGICGLNFVLENCLGGGGVASLRIDPQGKSLGQNLLDFTLKNVPHLLEK